MSVSDSTLHCTLLCYYSRRQSCELLDGSLTTLIREEVNVHNCDDSVNTQAWCCLPQCKTHTPNRSMTSIGIAMYCNGGSNLE